MNEHAPPVAPGESSDPEPGPAMDRLKMATWIYREDQAGDILENAPKQENSALSARAVSIALLLITVVYLVFEYRFGRAFATSIESGMSAPHELDSMSETARWLSAFGFALLIGRSTLQKWRETWTGVASSLAMFVGIWLFCYAGQYHVYRMSIDALGRTTALNVYTAFVTSNSPSYHDRAFSISRAISANPPDFDTEIKLSSERVAGELWPQISKGMGATASTLSAVDLESEFENAYSKYLRVANAGAKIRERFEATIGIEFTKHASKTDFANMLSQSRIQSYRDLGRAYLTMTPGQARALPFGLQIDDLASVKTRDDLADVIAAKRGASMRAYREMENPKLDPSFYQTVSAAILIPLVLTTAALAVCMNSLVVVLAVLGGRLTDRMRSLISAVLPLAVLAGMFYVAIKNEPERLPVEALVEVGRSLHEKVF